MTSITEMMDMTGRTAIVTGGGTHLGRAMSSALAEMGASIYIASRQADIGEATAADLRRQGVDVTARRRWIAQLR